MNSKNRDQKASLSARSSRKKQWTNTKNGQRRWRAITKQAAIEISPILLLQYEKIDNLTTP